MQTIVDQGEATGHPSPETPPRSARTGGVPPSRYWLICIAALVGVVMIVLNTPPNPWSGCTKAEGEASISACTRLISGSDAAYRPSAFYNRSVAYVRQGKPDLAMADVNDAIRLDPTLAAAFYDLPDLSNRKLCARSYDEPQQVELCNKIEESELALIKTLWPKTPNDIELEVHLRSHYFMSYHGIRALLEHLTKRPFVGGELVPR